MSQIKASQLQEILSQDSNAKDSVEMQSDKLVKSSKLDRLGVLVTGFCALHCLLLPVLLPILPLIASSFVSAAWFERLILSFSILLGFVALFIGFHKYHRQLYPLYSLALGGLIYWNKDIFGHSFEPLTIAVGACLIIGAHIANLKLCKSCKRC